MSETINVTLQVKPMAEPKNDQKFLIGMYAIIPVVGICIVKEVHETVCFTIPGTAYRGSFCTPVENFPNAIFIESNILK